MTETALALDRLRAGELVAIPTETVYGLAADAANPQAIAKIFALKGRPADHPVIVHIAGSAQLADWATDIPAHAWRLAEAFWPGPLTLILRRQPQVPDAVTGGQDTVGLRAPAHPVTQTLLRQFGGGLAAPSANRFGHVSPTTAQHVRDEFGSQCPLVLDGGQCEVGVESTIIALLDGPPKLLRPGGVLREQIEDLLGVRLEHHRHSQSAKLRVSGLLDSHYAPRTPLISGPMHSVRTLAAAAAAAGQRVAVLTLQGSEGYPASILLHPMPGDPVLYAHLIYDALRQLDSLGFDTLYLECPPDSAGWLAVNDRLYRASHQRIV
ncbi:L-threonylcarbamoyladenylate synthase [Chitiniphilus purpureus]|uniref:Threonylcarbamoyl-AMP synthase n=1 Tax=Chitiniphilus purpureus TaxID=2981137 RepID=A0ABY6DSH1_9NEIS|nr:L-threonylcarbamoyladenylate synthase [Chitiniphilus sp. CD1]UXY17324.1 L-threonylcarbamoyladenylate synthase [Chitiniphilus sp. CD1]